MTSPWSALLANVAIVAMFTSVWVHTNVWIDRRPFISALAFGVLMGIAAITSMAVPAELYPGVLIDLRATVVSIAGFFGGPVSGAAAAVIAIAYRIFEGGVGAPAGCISISIVAAIGIAGKYLVRSRQPRRMDILWLGAATGLGNLAGIGLLPGEVLDKVWSTAALPSFGLVFTSTILAGLTLYQERVRREALASKRIFRAVFEALPDCLNVKDLEGRFLVANPATARLMRAPDASALIGKTDFDFYPPETADDFKTDEEKVLREGSATTIEQHVVYEDGSSGWLSTLKSPFKDSSQEVVGLITHNRDITSRKALEAELAESRLRLSDALAHMADGLVMFDAQGKLVLCNDQYRSMFPMTADLRVPGAALPNIVRASVERGEIALDEQGVRDWVESVVIATRTPRTAQVQLTDGRWIEIRARPTEDGSSLSVTSDITAAKRAETELRAANKMLKRLAQQDGLTGLLTRRAFDEALTREIGRHRRNGRPLGLLLIDVDWFKRYNDYYGHPAGDECLKAVASCIGRSLRRSSDYAARYGGEEFGVILPETDIRGAFTVAQAIRESVRQIKKPHAASEKDFVTVSIGVAATIAGARPDGSELLNKADEALYGAKAAGRDRVHGWRPQLDLNFSTDRRPA